MQKLGESEQASIKLEGGEHLKNILSKFCKINNLPYPPTVLPQRDGTKMIIIKENKHREYIRCNKLILSWGGESSATLEKIPYKNLYSKISPRTIIPVSKPEEFIAIAMYPQDKPLKNYFEIGSTYILRGAVNGSEINLEARVSSLTTNEIPLNGAMKFEYHPKKTKRLDNNKKYWFLAKVK